MQTLKVQGFLAPDAAALRSLARTAAAELVGRGIRVNTVAPGPIVTPILACLVTLSDLNWLVFNFN